MTTNPILKLVALLFTTLPIAAADPVFSGPQPGEKTSGFQVIEVSGPGSGKERDPVSESSGKPLALVFVHGIERSLVPLLRVVDEYGAMRRDTLRTEFVFLSADRIEGEQRAKAAAGSLKLQSRIGLSVDGLEGPGNYGLNKDCLMTIVVADQDKVVGNFALVQPGIADAAKVLEALAKVAGDKAPPTVVQLTELHMSRAVGGRGGAMRRGGADGQGMASGVDLSKFDLNSEAGLRDAVRALIGEVQNLKAELANQRVGSPSAVRAEASPEKAREPFPGATPTDEKLVGLLRSFIRPTNDDALVDKVLVEVKEYIETSPELRKQALDGWTRVLHFGDRYGTEYARKKGREFLEQLKAPVR